MIFQPDKIVSIHNQETLAEDELYQTKTGDFFRLYHHLNINTDFFQPYNKSSLKSYLPLLEKAKQLLLIHNTFTNQDDIDFSNQQSSYCSSATVLVPYVQMPICTLKTNCRLLNYLKKIIAI